MFRNNGAEERAEFEKFMHDMERGDIPAPGSVTGYMPNGTAIRQAVAQATPPKKAEKRNNHLSVDVVREMIADLGYGIRLNIVSGQAEISGLPRQYSRENALNTLPVLLIDHLREQKYRITRAAMDDYLNVIADENRYNPVEDMIKSVEWDGEDRLGEIYRILGIETDDESCLYVQKWLHQCVALALNDDREPIKGDGVLVLHGPQGIGKTRFFTVIVVNPAWFCEGASIDMNNKDSIMRALGAWITELGELDSTMKREQSALKAFLTTAIDQIRPPYGRALKPSAPNIVRCHGQPRRFPSGRNRQSKVLDGIG